MQTYFNIIVTYGYM